MKNTGIFRNVDELGRVVVPKEMRRALGIREGDPVAIWIEKGAIMMKRASRNWSTQSALSSVIADLKAIDPTEKREKASISWRKPKRCWRTDHAA